MTDFLCNDFIVNEIENTLIRFAKRGIYPVSIAVGGDNTITVKLKSGELE